MRILHGYGLSQFFQGESSKGSENAFFNFRFHDAPPSTVDQQKAKSIALFQMGKHRPLFVVYFRSFPSTNLTEKTVGFSGIGIMLTT